jgi:hypothetical protein
MPPGASAAANGYFPSPRIGDFAGDRRQGCELLALSKFIYRRAHLYSYGAVCFRHLDGRRAESPMNRARAIWLSACCGGLRLRAIIARVGPAARGRRERRMRRRRGRA